MKVIIVYYLNNRLVDKKDINITDKFNKVIRRKENNYTIIKEYYYERPTKSIN